MRKRLVRSLPALALLAAVAGALARPIEAGASVRVPYIGRYQVTFNGVTTYRGERFRTHDEGWLRVGRRAVRGRTLGLDQYPDSFRLQWERPLRNVPDQQARAIGRITVTDPQGRTSSGELIADVRVRVSRGGRVTITGRYRARITSGRYVGAELSGRLVARHQ